MGSTNYGKLTNVSIAPVASQAAIDASNGNAVTGATTESGCGAPQKFDFIVTAVNYNIVRISGGALGKNGCQEQSTAIKSCALTFIDKQCKMHHIMACT
jgi:hypothetical protein